MVLCFDRETKRHSMEWRGSNSARQKKFGLQKSLVKTLLIVDVVLPELLLPVCS